MDTSIFLRPYRNNENPFAEGRLSSVELVTLYLARIDQLNTKLNAFFGSICRRSFTSGERSGPCQG
ncbi:MAG: hypothetical protein Ct9H300mP14_02790 [Gammaproteobacteria bacterium]|nr:MAG: hypothetical protein Ct9H300mP14_02790 [Gammaproteobacteria bacterium]